MSINQENKNLLDVKFAELKIKSIRFTAMNVVRRLMK